MHAAGLGGIYGGSWAAAHSADLVAEVEEDGPARLEELVVHEVALWKGVLGRVERRRAPVEVICKVALRSAPAAAWRETPESQRGAPIV